MTEKQFFASKWKPFEIMTVYVEEIKMYTECILIAVDFEERKMKLRPLDLVQYENDIFEVKINVISRGKDKTKLKILK